LSENGPTISQEKMSVQRQVFGSLAEGEPVHKFVLENESGMLRVVLTDYGASILSVQFPDKDGNPAELTLCNRMDFDAIVNKDGKALLGCTVGRFANRIREGKFALDGVDYQLATNNGVNHLHGGLEGFDTKLWTSEVLTDGRVGVKFTYLAVDGEEGFPGNLQTTVTYELTNGNDLIIKFEATTDKPTIVNLTNHAYFNLSGNGKRKVTDGQMLQLSCSQYLAVDETQIPTGELVDVTNTPFDFTQGKAIAEGAAGISGGGRPGIDHCFVVNGALNEEGNYLADGTMRHVGTVYDPISGREMTVHTTFPGVQVYTANFLPESVEHHPFIQHNAICLETQHFPDSINHGHFPSVVLREGEVYAQQAVYTFRVI
jgi:aldose 1-epimerase